ncbi:MAG TPA: hypothetical protein VFX17_00825 [Patescibacteria group bacterium]|nr:hypothetical protein [Patescibacteria group bacterium]
MTNQKHIIFAFIGASGSGKTTIMIELLNFLPHLQIIKSTSTRPRRDDYDDLFYKFVDEAYAQDRQNQAGFLSHEIYSGNHYIYERQNLDECLISHCGIFAIIESTVPTLRAQGYHLVLIKVIPDRDWELDRSLVREKADDEREKQSNLQFDLVIKNSFKPGGLEKSVQEAAKFISETISSIEIPEIFR